MSDIGCTPDVPHPGASCVDLGDPEPNPGDRVEFVGTTDEYTRLRKGDTGVVAMVDDLGTVHVAWDPDGHLLGLVPGVDVWRARRFEYPPAISPSLAPWSQLLDHLVTEFELDYSPEGALRAALAAFEQQHGHTPDPNQDYDEVADLAAEVGGWVA